MKLCHCIISWDSLDYGSVQKQYPPNLSDLAQAYFSLTPSPTQYSDPRATVLRGSHQGEWRLPILQCTLCSMQPWRGAASYWQLSPSLLSDRVTVSFRSWPTGQTQTPAPPTAKDWGMSSSIGLQVNCPCKTQ